RRTPRKRYVVGEAHLLGLCLEVLEAWPAAHKAELHIAPAEGVHDMTRSLEQQIYALLIAHHADIAHQKLAAASPRGIGRQRLDAREIGSAAHHEHVFASPAATTHGDLAVALIG